MPNSSVPLRRDWLLEQMGITQYELHRPLTLKGEVAVTLSADVRLIIITERVTECDGPLLADILRSMTLTQRQICCLTPERAVMLPKDCRRPLWLVGEANLPQTLGECSSKISSPNLSQLAHDPQSKKSLWQQICAYENDLLT